MDTLTKAFVSCFDDRPENPIERLLEILSETSRELPSNYMTKLEKAEIALAEARQEIEVLRKQLQEIGVEPAVPSNQPNTVSANVSHHPTPAKTLSSVSTSTGAIPKETQQPAPTTAVSTSTATSTDPVKTEASPESAKPETTEGSVTAATEAVVTSAILSTTQTTTTSPQAEQNGAST